MANLQQGRLRVDRVGLEIRVTRHTTIESRLWPRCYWEPIERLGVRSEHDFVLQSLDQKLRLAKWD